MIAKGIILVIHIADSVLFLNGFWLFLHFVRIIVKYHIHILTVIIPDTLLLLLLLLLHVHPHHVHYRGILHWHT